MIRAFAVSAFPAVVSHLVDSTLFLALMLAIIAMMRNRLTAGARFSLALLGIIKFAVPSLLIAPLLRPLFPTTSSSPLPRSLRAIGGALQTATEAAAPSLWPMLLMALWVVIAAACIVRFMIARHRLVALAVRTATPAEAREIDALTRAARRVGIHRSVDIARSAVPEAPAVLRTLRPLVVLPPRGCADLSDSELESLLCHEMAHVARYDNLVARVESVICALFWFHPLIWIAMRITVIERERACDEVVAGTADERQTYLTALTKFCHAAIAPRLPGVSCMATANLKERIDHVMKYPALKLSAPSATRVTIAASFVLVLFTATSAVLGRQQVYARSESSPAKAPYAVRVTATRSEGVTLLQMTVTENSTQTVIGSPSIKIDATRTASMRVGSGPTDVEFNVRPGNADDSLDVAFTVMKEGRLAQSGSFVVVPSVVETPAKEVFQGEPVSLTLKDADLRDLLGTFSKLTGIKMKIDDNVQGTVSVNWVNVPWDEALSGILKDNGMTYRFEGKTMIISKK